MWACEECSGVPWLASGQTDCLFWSSDWQNSSQKRLDKRASSSRCAAKAFISYMSIFPVSFHFQLRRADKTSFSAHDHYFVLYF